MNHCSHIIFLYQVRIGLYTITELSTFSIFRWSSSVLLWDHFLGLQLEGWASATFFCKLILVVPFQIYTTYITIAWLPHSLYSHDSRSIAGIPLKDSFLLLAGACVYGREQGGGACMQAMFLRTPALMTVRARPPTTLTLIQNSKNCVFLRNLLRSKKNGTSRVWTLDLEHS